MTAEAEAQSDTAKNGDGKATHFLFEHKIFGVKGAHFALAHDGTPLLHINLGDMKASLTLDTVRNEFGIKPDTHDCDLLTKVALGLRFVKEIRPRDSIPREILDGTASWTVEPRHLQIAKGRLMIQLSTWLTGREEVIADAEQLEQLVDDPTTKEKVNSAFDALAEQLGLGKARRQEVVDKIEDMARELSYIEGLRDYFGRIRQMELHLATCAQIFRREKTVMQDLGRVRSLVKPPISQFSMMFDQVDAQTGEILGALKNIQGQIDYIRKMRDDLHSRVHEVGRSPGPLGRTRFRNQARPGKEDRGHLPVPRPVLSADLGLEADHHQAAESIGRHPRETCRAGGPGRSDRQGRIGRRRSRGSGEGRLIGPRLSPPR